MKPQPCDLETFIEEMPKARLWACWSSAGEQRPLVVGPCNLMDAYSTIALLLPGKFLDIRELS